jgi:cbb3-type cytochrome oxidase subunit 3
MRMILMLVLAGFVVAALVYAYRPNRIERRIGAVAAALIVAIWFYLKFIAPD